MKHLPNLLTLLNACCGVVAIYFIGTHSTNGVILCLLTAAVADLFDGMVARKLGVSSPLGTQLDSLADAISFGVVPAFLWSSLLTDYGTVDQPYGIALGAIVAASSIYRLGRFNLSEDQKIDFIGVPTPANALFVLGLWLYCGQWDIWQNIVNMSAQDRTLFTAAGILLLALSAYSLNAPWSFMSFKSSGDKLRRNAQLFVVLLFIVLVIFAGALAFSITVMAVLGISQIVKILSKRKKNQL